MRLVDKIKEALERKESKMKVRGEISGTNWAEVRMTNIREKPITLGTPVRDLDIGIQYLTSGAKTFSQQGQRIDNSHGSLHWHSGSSLIPIEDKTMSGALLILLGDSYKRLETTDINPI